MPASASSRRARRPSSVRRSVASTRRQCGQIPTCASARRPRSIRARGRRTRTVGVGPAVLAHVAAVGEESSDSSVCLEKAPVEGPANRQPCAVQPALERRLTGLHHLRRLLGREAPRCCGGRGEPGTRPGACGSPDRAHGGGRTAGSVSRGPRSSPAPRGPAAQPGPHEPRRLSYVRTTWESGVRSNREWRSHSVDLRRHTGAGSPRSRS